jgi:aconitate hydratase
VLKDIETESLGIDHSGQLVFLRDLWPSRHEIDDLVSEYVTPDLFQSTLGLDAHAQAQWGQVAAPSGDLFAWDPQSSYIVEPPFFKDAGPFFARTNTIGGVRVLGVFDDGLTTDHLSPGGEIPPESPAGRYLQEIGVKPADFNTYVGRRGNHHVLSRGAYSNLRMRNKLTPDREGWWTRHFPEGEVTSFFEAAQSYRKAGVPLIVIAGQDFGSGSSRDWAAKGPALLGVGAVIAQSFERIHRSNLIGMGILPLIFENGETADRLGLDGHEEYEFDGIMDALTAESPITVSACGSDGKRTEFRVQVDVRTEPEARTLLLGGAFRATVERALAQS